MSPDTAVSPAVEARALIKTYPPGVRALDGLSITVPEGEIFGLLGPNGAGKSTATKILTTLALPDSGTANVAGEDVRRRPDQVRRRIGVVSQRSGADPAATGRNNLLLQGRLYRVPGPALRRRVDELLERFDLTQAADRKVRTYSGGMRRRLDVALGLIHRPRVLFLDEPTTGMDPQARTAMWDEITRLVRQEHLTVLFTTHYLDEADRLADRLAIIDRGRIVASGTPDELKGRLHGDTVTVELADAAPVDTARAALAALPGIREVTVAGRRLSARTDSGAAAIPATLASLERSGVTVTAVSVSRPSLDDVYLRYAGRRFAGDEAGDALATAGGAR